MFRNVFLLFHYYTPLEMGIALQLSKLESPSPRDALCQFKFNWNWPIGSGGKKFNFINVLSLFRYYLPLEICVALHLNELKYSSHKNVLFQVSLKLTKWFWRLKIFEFPQCIFAISLLSPLMKRHGPLFEQTWISFTQSCFVPSLDEIDSVVLEKSIKMWKVYVWMDHDRHNRLSENFTWSFSSGDLAKNKKKKKKNMYNTCRNHFHFKTLYGYYTI